MRADTQEREHEPTRLGENHPQGCATESTRQIDRQIQSRFADSRAFAPALLNQRSSAQICGDYARLKLSSVSSSAPWRRRMLARFCEKAERGITTSQPASWALTFRSPCTWETKPTIEVLFLYLALILVITGSGLMPLLFRSTMIRDGFSSVPSVLSVMSLSVLTNSTFTFNLREISWILATKKRSSTKAKIRVGASTRCTSGSILGEACTPLWKRAPCWAEPLPWLR